MVGQEANKETNKQQTAHFWRCTPPLAICAMCTSKERFVVQRQRDCRDFKHYIGEDFNRLLQKVKQILSGEPLNVADDAERKRVFRLKNNFKMVPRHSAQIKRTG
ncbi:hypothetical protein T10_1357 [Trichinella papuae]|uniref:Uncharacterized protein n=1 Tax=Trichinella papuae TaxID=268474 RepID=A0A0V1MQM9_9BILA|nr:hypothetical protein T10_1357 [Trichinella papuae]